MEKAKVEDHENLPQQMKGIKRKRSLKRHQGLTDISNFQNDFQQKDEIITRSKAKRRKTLEQEEELRKKKEFNIDEDDNENPQCVTDYVEDIYKYMRTLESQYYIQGKDKQISERVVGYRKVLIDWLVDVHLQFRFLQETLYLTVNILDRYLHAKTPNINKKLMQLYGVTAMLIASKYEEMYPPAISDFVYITDNAYTEVQIRAMEIMILKELNFNFSPPLLINFLRRYSKAGDVEAKVHLTAKYVLECSLLDYELSCFHESSKLAAGALCYSLIVNSKRRLSLNEVWTDKLEYHSSYGRDQVGSVLAIISKKMFEVTVEKKVSSVKKKYSHKSFHYVAEMPDFARTDIG